MNWFHEPSHGPAAGSKTLLKTAFTADEPYEHTIRGVEERHLGRYICHTGSVVGEAECTAHLGVVNAASVTDADAAGAVGAAWTAWTLTVLLWGSPVVVAVGGWPS